MKQLHQNQAVCEPRNFQIIASVWEIAKSCTTCRKSDEMFQLSYFLYFLATTRERQNSLDYCSILGKYPNNSLLRSIIKSQLRVGNSDTLQFWGVALKFILQLSSLVLRKEIRYDATPQTPGFPIVSQDESNSDQFYFPPHSQLG